VNLVSQATPPIKSTKPNKLKLLLMAVMASLGAGVAVPFAYELFLNRRIRCRDDIERDFKLPVLIELGKISPVTP
jgi:capsular polysaccharide biosynthesis protein